MLSGAARLIARTTDRLNFHRLLVIPVVVLARGLAAVEARDRTVEPRKVAVEDGDSHVAMSQCDIARTSIAALQPAAISAKARKWPELMNNFLAAVLARPGGDTPRGGHLGGLRLLLGQAKDVRAKVVPGDSSPTLFIESARQCAIEALFDAQRLAEVANAGAGTLRVLGLIQWREGFQVASERFHDPIITVR